MPAEFDGVEEKLERADESIQNLHSEISRFFQECKYPVLPKLNDEKILEAVRYHKTLPIPPRFSVLAGEIVHHLRSCLDHIIWGMSDDASRLSRESKYIEFPILSTRPTPKDKFTRYDRKIQGVKNVDALSLIDKLQPYQRIDPINSPLAIIQKMDVTDKHKELVIINGTGMTEGFAGADSSMLAREFLRHLHAAEGPQQLSPELKRQLDQHTKTTPQISFAEFGGWTIQPVVPGLIQLMNHVVRIVAGFEMLIP
jgi:hypothetical protein